MTKQEARLLDKGSVTVRISSDDNVYYGFKVVGDESGHVYSTHGTNYAAVEAADEEYNKWTDDGEFTGGEE